MNENMKREMLAALIAHAVDRIEKDEENELTPKNINSLIKSADLGIKEMTPEVCPARALFNLIEALCSKVDALEKELNFVKNAWNPNDPVKLKT